MRVGVLASGSGTNLQALLDADLGDARVVLVIANVPGAKALDRARAAGVASQLINHRDFPRRVAFDAALVEALREADVDLVVLAGFMRIVTTAFLDAFPDRVINIHPSLLPAFPGVDAQRQAFEAGVRVTGCTVHLVDAGTDTGPILAQAAVPVRGDDALVDLQRRILAAEHRLLPAVVKAFAAGTLAPLPRPQNAAKPQASSMAGDRRTTVVSGPPQGAPGPRTPESTASLTLVSPDVVAVVGDGDAPGGRK